MWKLSFCAIFMLTALAHAAPQCNVQSPRKATVNLDGVHAITIDIGRHSLHLVGSQTNVVSVDGRACASSLELISALRLDQRREGDRLVLTATSGPDSSNIFGFLGRSRYANLELRLAVPADMPVELVVGSGDADVVGVSRLSTNTESGDLHVHDVKVRFDATLGTGNIEVSDAGQMHIASIGSGDFKAERVHGDVQIGSLGSGDATLHAVDGSVDVGSVGSGDLVANGVKRDFRVHHIGSGNVTHLGVSGLVDVPEVK